MYLGTIGIEQISVYLCIIYGIVIIYRYIVIIKSYIHVKLHISSLILPKCVKTREPKDEHCVSWCTSIVVTPYP